MVEFDVRQARADDHEAVAAFTADTWSDRGVGDYIPDVFPEWVEGDGPDQRTFVLEADGDVAGLCQGVLLSDREAWAQGMRVAPSVRGAGASRPLNEAVFDWAAERGATVCRNMVFSWNDDGLGTSRSLGYDPRAEFRWTRPDPDPDAEANAGTGLRAVDDPDAAWACWQRSDARDALAGLALDRDESWALAELTPERLAAAADDGGVVAVQDDEGTRAFAHRVREFERESEGDGDGEDAAGAVERWAEYGAAAWADQAAARTLFAAVRRDAAAADADRARVLIPETPRHVSDAVYAGVGISDDPDFVFEADLTARSDE